MAGSPGGKSVGRVSIRVVPDSTQFGADLKKSLERIEKSTTFNVALGIDTRQAEIDLKKFQKDWNGQAINFDIDASTAAASAHLTEFSRRRSVDVDVNLNKVSLAKATAALGAISGGRVTVNALKDLGTRLSNLDTSIPKIAAVAFAVGSIGSLALSSVAGLVTMAAALSTLAALGSVLPAMFAAAAVSVVALVVAFQDASTELESLNPLWKKLQSTIQDNFWDKAKQPILDLVHSVFPQLQAGLASVSTALGTWAGSVASSFQKAFGGGVLQGLMTQLSQAITNSTAGTDAFAQSIATLGQFGGQYLPAIGTWFSTIATQFNGWLAQVASNGTLQAWVSTAMTVLGQLGSIISNTIGIFGGLFSAAENAGSGGLATLASALGAIAKVINTPAFQTTLTTIFQGAAAGVQGLGAALGPIGQLLGSLSTALGSSLGTIGQTLGTVISTIAKVLDKPEIAAGLQSAIQGLASGLLSILPALGPVATALAPLLTLIGQLAQTIGPVLGAALQVVAPLIGQLAQLLLPIVQAIGPSLVQIIGALAPLFQGLMPLISAILSPLANLASALGPILTPILQALTPAIQLVADILTALIDLLNGNFAGAGAAFGNIWKLMQTSMTAGVNFLRGAIQTFAVGWNATWSGITTFFRAQWNVIIGIANTIGGAFSKAFSTLGGIVSGAFNGIVSIIKGAINGVIDVVNTAITGINTITGAVGIPKIPKIPHLASGADVEASAGGTMVVLGEGGKSETVTNRGLTNRMIENTNALVSKLLAGGVGGGGTNVTINEVSDPIGTSMAVVRRLEALGA
ncbi:hypothetical protein [Humibacter sp. RRB41]|uniref:phage tail protein n=1 Tax=Humibacter sp. RRB41 TaxID=2919946 RepID=UPI001FAAB8EC|nr:hypothetical protein [Humibacter sp. RRB41]